MFFVKVDYDLQKQRALWAGTSEVRSLRKGLIELQICLYQHTMF
jgi:hypothetical protein